MQKPDQHKNSFTHSDLMGLQFLSTKVTTFNQLQQVLICVNQPLMKYSSARLNNQLRNNKKNSFCFQGVLFNKSFKNKNIM